MPAQKFSLTVEGRGGIILGGHIRGWIVMVEVKWNDRRPFCLRFGFSGCARSTWSAASIDISILVISLKAGSARQGSLVVSIGFKSVSFIIGDDCGRKVSHVLLLVAHLRKAREDVVAGRTSQDSNISDSGEWHSGFETTTTP
jgi:hypothetical protein